MFLWLKRKEKRSLYRIPPPPNWHRCVTFFPPSSAPLKWTFPGFSVIFIVWSGQEDAQSMCAAYFAAIAGRLWRQRITGPKKASKVAWVWDGNTWNMFCGSHRRKARHRSVFCMSLNAQYGSGACTRLSQVSELNRSRTFFSQLFGFNLPLRTFTALHLVLRIPFKT